MSDEDGKRNYGGVIIALIVVLVFPISFYYYFEGQRLKGGTVLKDLPYLTKDSLPEFRFISQDGDTITRDSLRGNIVIADFFFTTCPGICKTMTNNMEKVQAYLEDHDALTSKYRLLSHTVNPAHDSVPELQKYAEEHHVDSDRWWLVTGDQKELYTLATGFYKLPAMEVAGDTTMAEPFVHSERFVLLDKKGLIRGYYDGTDTSSVNKMLSDMVILDVKYAVQDGIDKKRITRGKKN
jgi:protein SCO1/2